MSDASKKRLGFACAYTPLALMDAAGFQPYRVLPVSEAPDQAGQLMHDNLCPHVKRILDRVMAGELEDLAGMIFVNCCDAMRRLSDAWQVARPGDQTLLLDLPVNITPLSVSFYAAEIKRLADALAEWSGTKVTAESVRASIEKYRHLAEILAGLAERQRLGSLTGGAAKLQEYYNLAAAVPVDEAIARLEAVEAETADPPTQQAGIPLFMFGNMLPEPAVFQLLESAGGHILGADFCTGSRLFNAPTAVPQEDIFMEMAAGLLSQPPCASTFDAARPVEMAENLLARAQSLGARGIMGHTLKFCDPYINRMPVVRDILKAADMPFLFIEGDMTLRSVEQQRTRIEAFIEMLNA